MMTQENTLEGRNLRSILDEGPLPIARAIRIAHDIAVRLADVHLKGVVHGNLKPSSILILPSGGVKITGFASEPIDHRADIFAFGALLYEMLTHQPPIEGKPPAPSELNSYVPRSLDAIVLSMLARDPAARMPGVPILLRELKRLQEGLGLAPEAPGRREPDPHIPSDLGSIRPGPSATEAIDLRKQIIDREVFDHQRAMMERAARQRPSSSRIEIFTALGVVLVVLGAGVAGFLYFTSDPKVRAIAASRTREAPAPAVRTAPPPVAETARQPAPAPVADLSKEPVAAFGAWQSSRTASRPTPPPPPVAEAPKELPPAPAVVRPVAPAPVAEAPKEPATEPATEPTAPGTLFGLDAKRAKPLGPDPATLVVEAPKPAAAAPAPVQEAPHPVKAAAKVPPPQPRGKAQLVLAVSPGGEIYIDGNYLGETPPMTTFDLDPGMYRIEVRSASHKPFLTYMTVEPGDVRRIRHDFNAKPSRPPS